jgi:hypothetical protein
LKLGQDPADVYLGGAFADVHVLGDLRVGQSVPHQGEDFEFLLGEHREPASGLYDAVVLRLDVAVDESAGDGWREDRLASGGGADGLDQVVRRGVLEQEPGGTGPQRASDVRVLAEGRQHDDLGARG